MPNQPILSALSGLLVHERDYQTSISALLGLPVYKLPNQPILLAQ